MAAADLINRATSAPNTYIFTELLSQPNIAALAFSPDPSSTAWHTHLLLFSHGLYSTYLSTPDLPPLNVVQTLKLRQLSLLTLSRSKSALTYPSLLSHLHLGNARELEDVVISAVYAGLLVAKLNPARQEVQVSSVAPLRDVPPQTVAGIVATLAAWSARCDATLAELEGTVGRLRADAARELELRREDERVVAAAVAAAEGAEGGPNSAKSTDSGAGGGGTRSARQRRAHGGAAGGAMAGLRSQLSGGAAKRGSEKLMEATAGADDDDEAMDLDDEGGDAVGQKRASRRKL